MKKEFCIATLLLISLVGCGGSKKEKVKDTEGPREQYQLLSSDQERLTNANCKLIGPGSVECAEFADSQPMAVGQRLTLKQAYLENQLKAIDEVNESVRAQIETPAEIGTTKLSPMKELDARLLRINLTTISANLTLKVAMVGVEIANESMFNVYSGFTCSGSAKNGERDIAFLQSGDFPTKLSDQEQIEVKSVDPNEAELFLPMAFMRLLSGHQLIWGSADTRSEKEQQLAMFVQTDGEFRLTQMSGLPMEARCLKNRSYGVTGEITDRPLWAAANWHCQSTEIYENIEKPGTTVVSEFEFDKELTPNGVSYSTIGLWPLEVDKIKDFSGMAKVKASMKSGVDGMVVFSVENIELKEKLAELTLANSTNHVEFTYMADQMNGVRVSCQKTKLEK